MTGFTLAFLLNVHVDDHHPSSLFCSCFVKKELPGIGQPNWFLLTLLSPYAGLYYWRAGDRVDECSIKLVANDAETENMMVVQGPEEEIERMWRTMDWQEKGMVKVPGLLDSIA